MTVDIRELHPAAQVTFMICVTIAVVAFCYFWYRIITD